MKLRLINIRKLLPNKPVNRRVLETLRLSKKRNK